MRLILVRHAEAVPASSGAPDGERPLTPEGVRQAGRAGRAIRSGLIEPARILTSPKKRAAETAQVLAELLGSAPPQNEEMLRGGWEPSRVLGALRGKEGSLVLVGHEPDMGRLLAALLDPAWSGTVPLATAGFAEVDVEDLPPRRPGRLVRFGGTPGREEPMLDRNEAALIVVDVQSKLVPHIDAGERTVLQIARLIRGFRIVGAPILLTEQYPQGLGETDPRVREALTAESAGLAPGAWDPLEKMSFSCCGDGGFREALAKIGRRQLVLCGIEAHVCVLQTALDLLREGYHVEVAADAVSSRAASNREIALTRLSREGASLTTVESCVFEMLGVCGTDAFKRWVKVIR